MNSVTIYVYVLSMFCEVFTFSKSGIYLDNGLDQTYLDDKITKLEEIEVEQEILNLLGLPNRPQKLHNSLTSKSPTKYLLDIYENMMVKLGHSRTKRSADIYLSDEEKNVIEESDLIMTFDFSDQEESSLGGEKGKRLWFNLTEMTSADYGVSAELRVFQRGTNKTKAKNIFEVTLYELVDNEKKLRYVSSVNTTKNFRGWLSMNLTSCILEWNNLPYSKKGFYLTVYSAGRPGREISPEDIGLTVDKQADETQLFMVAFLKATNYVQPRRIVRSVSHRRVKKSDYTEIMKSYYGAWRTCRIHTLYISFKDLQWQDWVIAPEGYAAYYCAGECNFPLNAHMNATKHALVQSLVHLIQPRRFPKPCCVPTELSSIPLVYYLDAGTNNVILKKYSNMAVKSCGCH